MARKPRRQQQVVGAYYHVMNPGHNREPPAAFRRPSLRGSSGKLKS
jgi:hypothetical protein